MRKAPAASTFFFAGFLSLTILAPLAAMAKPGANGDAARLPRFFQPFHWDMKPGDLKARFPQASPGSKISLAIDGPKTREITAYRVSGLKPKGFGKVSTMAGVFFDREKLVRIDIQTFAPQEKGRAYYDRLFKIYQGLKDSFSKKHGRPVEDPVAPEGPQPYPAKSCQWSTPGFKLLIFLFADNEAKWSLTVSVSRKEK